MLKHLSSWYQRTFLPFEQEGHPLYAGKQDPSFVDELSAWVDEELEVRPRHKGSMLVHTRSWYEQHEPDIDFDSLPKA